jgi:hypothetical protein
VVNDAQGVLVVAEAASMGGEGVGEGILAGVAERGMAEVVSERNRLRQVFVQA